MPVDLPNRRLFRPLYPKSKDTHALFGIKYQNVHRFRDDRWPPTAPISQYKYMVNVLGKNLRFKRLERNVNNINEKKNLISLRNQCHDGRIRLHTAKQGNLMRISNILLNHRELRRMYQGLPSHVIVEKINQRTFLKRKENDRLKYKLKILMGTYSDILVKQSKIEDRIKYQNEFILQEELNSNICRKELANSVTRIKAYKLITRAYQKILETLKRDDIYLESILNSLEDDILEQSNFIQQVILLGIPAISKYKTLAAEYQQSEDEFREQIRKNLVYITQFKKQVKEEEDDVKKIVRKNCDSKGRMREYLRETLSMHSLRTNIEEMDKTMQSIKNATFSPLDTDIIPKMEKTVFQNIKMEKHLGRENETMFKLEDKEKKSEAMIRSLIHNSCDAEIQRLETIKQYKDAIKNEKQNQEAADYYIIKHGQIFDIFRVSLCNLVEIVRHVGSSYSHGGRKSLRYPNEELKLPLLIFPNEDKIMKLPPIPKNIQLEKMMEILREKIMLLQPEVSRYGKEVKNYNALYTKAYVESVEYPLQTFRKSLEEFDTNKPDINIPTRNQIKMLSIKIVTDHKMREEFGI